MNGISLIILIVTVVISTNGLIINWFDRLTMYNGVELHYYSGWFTMLCVCFCVFLVPFYKPIREYRKVVYIKNSVRRYEFWWDSLSKFGGMIRNVTSDSEYERYVNNKRYLKLKELKRKTKKHRIWK